MFERVVVPDLQQAIQQQIKRYILDKRLREGDRLPSKEDPAHQLGSSRTAIREALSGLEALGLIEVRHGSGRYVRPFNFSAVLDNLAHCKQHRSLYDALARREALLAQRCLMAQFAGVRAWVESEKKAMSGEL